MAIPTQFSVTSTRTSPIANPSLPKDPPQPAKAENVSIVDGADILSSLSSGAIDLPSSATAESKSVIGAPDTAFARGKSAISTPDAASASSKVLIDAPSSATAESAHSVDTPSGATAEASTDVNAPTSATAEISTGVQIPSSKTALAKADVSVPSEKSALDKAAISAPSGATAESAISPNIPSTKTAQSTTEIDAPSAKAALNANTPDVPSAKTAQSAATTDTPSALNSFTYGTNLLTYSEQFDNALWNKTEVLIEPNAAIAPNGELTADRVIDTNVNSTHRIFDSGIVSVGVNITVSIFAKAETIDELFFPSAINGAEMESSVIFNLTSRTISGSSKAGIISDGNGWYRCFAVYTSTGTSVTPQFRLAKNGDSGYVGSGESILLWGAQLEESSWPNQYVKTEATPVTVASSADAPTAASVLPSADIDAPTEATARPAVPASAPSALTANPRTPTTPPFPLNHMRILADNALKRYSTLTATSSAAGFPVTNALTANTGQTWRFTTAASTLQLDFGGGTEQIDMLCIGGHNLGRAGATVEVYYEPEPGGTLVKFGDTKNLNVTQNDALCFYSETILEALSIEVRITNASGVPQISYISGGVALQMQRPFFNGHVPITDADVTEFYNPRTESGNIRSRLIRRQGYKTSYDFNNIDDTWYRTYFAPVKELLKTEVIFTAWNLLEYPDDIGFGLVEGDINTSMQNGFGTKRSSLSFTLLGY